LLDIATGIELAVIAVTTGFFLLTNVREHYGAEWNQVSNRGLVAFIFSTV